MTWTACASISCRNDAVQLNKLSTLNWPSLKAACCKCAAHSAAFFLNNSFAKFVTNTERQVAGHARHYGHAQHYGRARATLWTTPHSLTVLSPGPVRPASPGGQVSLMLLKLLLVLGNEAPRRVEHVVAIPKKKHVLLCLFVVSACHLRPIQVRLQIPNRSEEHSSVDNLHVHEQQIPHLQGNLHWCRALSVFEALALEVNSSPRFQNSCSVQSAGLLETTKSCSSRLMKLLNGASAIPFLENVSRNDH